MAGQKNDRDFISFKVSIIVGIGSGPNEPTGKTLLKHDALMVDDEGRVCVLPYQVLICSLITIHSSSEMAK